MRLPPGCPLTERKLVFDALRLSENPDLPDTTVVAWLL